MARRTARPLKPAPIVPPAPTVAPPLPAQLLSAPRQFGEQLAASETVIWQYWPALVITSLLAGLAYALLMRPGLNLAAAEALRVAGQTQAPAPTILSHVTNAFGTFFLTVLTFLLMWGLGRLGAGPGRDTRGARVAEIYSASFALLIPLYLLCTVLVLFTPASAWALAPGEITAAHGNLLDLQRAALHSAAQTPAALALIVTSVLGTLAQFGLAYPALRQTTGQTGRAVAGVLLPLLPALGVQLVSVGALLAFRH